MRQMVGSTGDVGEVKSVYAYTLFLFIFVL